VLGFNTQAGSQSFTFLKQLFSEDGSWVGQQEMPYTYFAERLALAYEGTLDDIIIQESYQERAESEDQWLTLPYTTPDGMGSLSLETVSIGIAKGTPAEQLGSWLFTRWLLSQEAQERLVHIHGYWPVTDDPQAVAADYAKGHPAWASAFLEDVRLTLAPEAQNWAYGRLILQDAVRRMYALDEEYIPTVLEMLDNTLQELTGENLHEP
jgi:ABC-type glycerol-3-phosphate transport system substrate-binding protein